MASSFQSALHNLRETKVWKSVFRRGPANTNRTRSLAIFGNLFLHWMPVKVREKSLRVRASYYLGSISFILFIVLFVTVFWHMFHVFYRGGYKPPHEFNWVVGVVLLLLTLFLSYTGYLLPWDQLAFWAVTVGTNIISAMPFIGHKVRFLLLGGNIVGENALLRFYVLHVVILPLAAFVLIGIHFWRVQKDGGLTVKPKDEDGKE